MPSNMEGLHQSPKSRAKDREVAIAALVIGALFGGSAMLLPNGRWLLVAAVTAFGFGLFQIVGLISARSDQTGRGTSLDDGGYAFPAQLVQLTWLYAALLPALGVALLADSLMRPESTDKTAVIASALFATGLTLFASVRLLMRITEITVSSEGVTARNALGRQRIVTWADLTEVRVSGPNRWHSGRRLELKRASGSHIHVDETLGTRGPFYVFNNFDAMVGAIRARTPDPIDDRPTSAPGELQ